MFGDDMASRVFAIFVLLALASIVRKATIYATPITEESVKSLLWIEFLELRASERIVHLTLTMRAILWPVVG